MDFGSNSKSKQRKIIKAGQHVGVLFSIVDLGTQKVKNFKTGEMVDRKQVELAWEFPLFRATYNEDKGPQVMAHYQKYTKSFFGSARLKDTIQTWTGDKIQGNSYDLESLLGKACHIQIEQNPDKTGRKDDDTGAPIVWQNMNGHPTMLPAETREKYETKVAEGFKVPFLRGENGVYETENSKVYFDLQNFDQKVFDELNKFKKEMIAETPEFKALQAEGKATYSAEEAQGEFVSQEEEDDDPVKF